MKPTSLKQLSNINKQTIPYMVFELSDFSTSAIYFSVGDETGWGGVQESFLSQCPAGTKLRKPIKKSHQWVLWVKREGREADHSPPPSVEVKNAWSYTSSPPNTPSRCGDELSTRIILPLTLRKC
jgi:hypothetical protein